MSESVKKISTGNTGGSTLQVSTANSVILIEFEEGDRLVSVRIRLTPEEAKEMAKALTKFANAVVKENT